MLHLIVRFATITLICVAVGSILDGWILWTYGAWNLLAASYYAFDKLIAVQNGQKRRQATRLGKTSGSERRRISESKLLWLAALFGAGGALVSMLMLWHKVKKWPFFMAVPILLIAQVALLWWFG